MSKHTPGPWLVSSSLIVCTDHAQIIANATPTGISMLDVPFGEVAHNARLIAAAPDLLAVLQEFGERFVGPHWVNTSDDWLELCQRYEAAIAKATGGDL